ncbi:uncharacterized protein [Chelonus insularis]|nr:uncharacterized protein LOC118066363 [Chelonus insularis]
MKNLSLDDLNTNANFMFQKLLECYRIGEITDESKYQVLSKLYGELSRKVNKNAIPLFKLNQVNSSIEDIEAGPGESPRCVIYMDEGRIAVAYVVADNKTQVKMKSPTMENIVVCLMSTYYVWHVKYPSPYKNILQYIDNALLGTSVQANQVISRFIRKRDAIVQETQKDSAENEHS